MARFMKKKTCIFCDESIVPSYKNVDVLKTKINERGKIMPRRITGVCAKHQRALSTEIKRARMVALLPFVAENLHK